MSDKSRKDRIEDDIIVDCYDEDVSIDDFVATIGVEKNEHIYDIPLEMIRGIDCDEGTCEVIEDWRYWCEKFLNKKY